MWSIDWAVERIQPDLRAGLAKAGRKREDVDLNLWLWAAVNPDQAQAIEDSRATMAFYGGVQQYESFFEAHGFGNEALRLQQAVKSGQALASGHLVPDDMVKAFVLCGKPDAVRARVERGWTVARSMCLVPPVYGLPREKLLF